MACCYNTTDAIIFSPLLDAGVYADPIVFLFFLQTSETSRVPVLADPDRSWACQPRGRQKLVLSLTKS